MVRRSIRILPKILRSVYALAALLALLVTVSPAHAQFIGYTSPQTVNQNVFTATSCNGTLKSANLQNVGQSVHIITYVFGGINVVQNPVVRIMGSNDGTNFFQISDDGSGQVFIASLAGYGSLPFVQIWVVNGVAGCTVTANYEGTSVSTTNPTGVIDQSAYRKQLFTATPANTTQTYSGLVTPYGNAGGLLIYLPTGGGAPAGSTITLGSGDSGSNFQTITLGTSAGSKVFPVNNFPASTLTVTYTSGGASANSLTLVYVFAKPGATSVAPQYENSTVINTASAGPTQIIAAVVGSQIRIGSINVSSGTAEAIDLQQGTGANCATGNSQLSGLTHLAANAPWIQSFPGEGLVALPGNAVCIHLSGGGAQTDGTMTYSQF